MSQEADTIEHLTPGLIHQQIGPYFYKFILADMSRPTVDAFVKRASEWDKDAYKAQHHIRGLYILQPGALFSPHLLSEAMKASYSRSTSDDASQSIEAGNIDYLSGDDGLLRVILILCNLQKLYDESRLLPGAKNVPEIGRNRTACARIII